ncbi:hypothetical protein ACIQ57_18775 [Lysinibacillus xylanilyticus]|uniref:hypothetical protein n=1 Tax=Lysinibacillus xylanilyticus TaxID=582475 RepID=UPI0037F31B31
MRKRSANEAAHRTPPGSSALCESEASATNVLSARKRSVSGIVLSVRKCNDSNNKAPSQNGNQPHVLVISQKLSNEASIS